MKTRRLTKKNLDELAQVIPILNEKEQSEIVGGDYFFKADGTFLGQQGDGVNVRVTTDDDWNTIQSCYGTSNPPGYLSKPLSGCDATTTTNIVNSIAVRAGYNSGISLTYVMGEDPSRYGGESNENITINGNSDLFTRDNTNMFDVISVITHEYEHSYNPELEDTPEGELKALAAQKNHYSYQYLSHDMKKTINDNIRIYKKIVEDRLPPQG